MVEEEEGRKRGEKGNNKVGVGHDGAGVGGGMEGWRDGRRD